LRIFFKHSPQSVSADSTDIKSEKEEKTLPLQLDYYSLAFYAFYLNDEEKVDQNIGEIPL